MQHLVASPRLFGWNWDVALVDGGGYGNTNPVATKVALSSDSDVEAWSGAFYGADAINGQNIPLLGMEPASSVIPPLHEGRMIQRPGEIVLGTATLDQLGVAVGDTVRTSSGRVRVVGSATLPTIGVVHGDHTSLGVGGIVTSTQVPGWDRNVEDPTAAASGAATTPRAEYGPNVVFVRFRKGIDRPAALARLQSKAEHVGDYNGVELIGVQRSAEIVNADNVRNSSQLLAGAVALSALASVALALTAAVHRRQRQLALLKALGFTRLQVAATVAWQATAVIVVGLVIGVPLGIAAGRVLWDVFARQLDVVAEPAVPVIAVTLIVIAALAVANALAVVPARYALRIRAASAVDE
jgi:hypothetical protein